MGVGKSTIGIRLAQRMKFDFLDTDERIEQQETTKITEIFAKKGEAYFRELETVCLKTLLKQETTGFVISVGGGLPVKEENQRLLKELGTVIYLKAEPETIYERIKDDTTRPLLQTANPLQKMKEMMQFREEKYQNAAEAEVRVDGKEISEIIEEIISIFGGKE